MASKSKHDVDDKSTTSHSLPCSAASSTRVRCSSAGGRDEKAELAARYWAYLFENLERSITEIYNTSEKQENILQCKEVLLILENYTHDFGNLIEWLELKWKYEQTPQLIRPNALAWEIRKPSFSALPHTRAYEQLVGINSSPPSRTTKDKNTNINSLSYPAISAALCIENHPDFLSKPDIEKIVHLPTLQQQQEQPPPVDLVLETAEIGLQTDLEEDPDIYYFAGGRHVGSQTDYTDEYGPLDPGFPDSVPFEPSPTMTSQSTTKIEIPIPPTAVPSASVLRPTLASKSKVKPVPRSNIASRFRTALNKPSSAAGPVISNVVHQSVQYAQQIKQHISSSSSKSNLNSAQASTATTSSNISCKPIDALVKNNSAAAAAVTIRPGVSRSKSMINPAALSKMKGRSGTNANVGKNAQKSIVSQSFMSLPDETKFEKSRGNIVDEDGWETVRARSSRSSKRSPSSSSLHSSTATLSRNSIDKGAGGEEDGIMSSSVDYEEIKKKEAALDSAVREEELLEEELLQIEKDFEEIENRVSQSGNVSEATEASETDNITSSPEIFLEEIENENRDAVSSVSKKDDGRSVSSINPMSENKANYIRTDLDADLFCTSLSKQERARAEECAPREPGRIVTLREKLMSPAKRYDSAETLRRYQAKLEKAERNREKLLQSKYNRYVELSDRFETLNETTKRLMEERAVLISRAQERRKRAEEKRQEYLRGIKRKAHDEDSKAREIAFINLIEAQNKRHDYLILAQGIEDRLHGREEERKLKLEERGTKVSAVIERQFRIRSNWEIKLGILEEKRRQAAQRIAREKQEKAKERSDLALEKARDREERMSAINAAKEAEKEVLQKKIQQRQEDTARRHEENIEHIRQKAVELSVPRSTDDNIASSTVRMCTLCNVTMHSEVQELAHVRAKSHLDAVRSSEKAYTSSTNPPENFGFKFITDVQLDKVKPGVPHDKGRLKVMKKHSKKLLQNLMSSGLEFEEKSKPTESLKSKGATSSSRIQKILREISRLTTLFSSGKGSLHNAHALDRLFGEARKQVATTRSVQDSMINLGAFTIAKNILDCKATDLPHKVIIAASNFIIGAVYQNLPNAIYVLKSSSVCSILESVSSRWNALVPDDNRWLCGSPMGINEPLPVDPILGSLVQLLFNILNIVPDPLMGLASPKGQYLTEAERKQIENRTLDIIGYLVASGVIDRFTVYCSGVRGPVDNQPQVAGLVQFSLDFLIMLIYALKSCWDPSKTETTMLLAALESSELAGAVSMSYALLFHQGVPTRPRQGPEGVSSNDNQISSTLPTSAVKPPPPGLLTVSIVKCALCLINAIASLDVHLLQNVLGSEAVSLQFRHISSQLLWQVVPHRTEDTNLGRLLKELLIAIGNFTVSNKFNQATIQSGQTPTVLQQLCSLSHEYSSDPKLSSHYLPTIIAASYGCEENEAILIQHDIKREELEGFMKSEFAKVNAITKRLLQSDGTFSYALTETTVIKQNSPAACTNKISSSGGGGKKNKKSQAKS